MILLEIKKSLWALNFGLEFVEYVNLRREADQVKEGIQKNKKQKKEEINIYLLIKECQQNKGKSSIL